MIKRIDYIKDNLFWSLITESQDSSNNLTEQYDKLLSSLSKLSAIEILEFEILLTKKIKPFFEPKTLAYLNKINEFLNYEDLTGFAGWVILKGEIFYDTFLKNPDLLVNDFWDSSRVQIYCKNVFEITYIADQAFINKHKIPDDQAYVKYILPTTAMIYIMPNHKIVDYEPWNDDDFMKTYPETAKRIIMSSKHHPLL